MVDTIVLPPVANLLSNSITYNAVDESRPVVGSSRNTKLGFVSNSTPIEARFLSPPDTPLMMLFPMRVLALLVRPNSMMSCSTLFFFSGMGKSNLKLAENMNASLAVNVANKISSYIT